MAILNRKYGYLFLSEPYCASRAVKSALAEQDGSVVLDTWVHNSFPKLVQLGFLKYHEPVYKFSIIRNPLDYLVTKFHHLTGWHKNGFQSFLRAQSGTQFLHANDVDKTLRYEHLESQLNELLESRGAPPVSLTVVGKTESKRPWQSYYMADDIAVARAQVSDFRLYGY